MSDAGKTLCRFCTGRTTLTQGGIFRVYLRPHIVPAIIVVAGIALSIIFANKLWLLLSALGLFIPLARADMRLYLYPVVAIAKLFGASIGCPDCHPTGKIFVRKEHSDTA